MLRGRLFWGSFQSRGVATEGVAPIFSWKTDDLFYLSPSVSSAVSLLFIFSWKTDDLFLLITVTLISLGCHPPGGCHPTLFLPVRPRFSTIFVNLPTIFSPSGVSPWSVSPGAVLRSIPKWCHWYAFSLSVNSWPMWAVEASDCPPPVSYTHLTLPTNREV